jgi:decaprenylphospho-beta-D-ribofuranose 2-oxidase
MKDSYNSIYQIIKILKENRIYSFVSVLKSMRKNNKRLSFGQEGLTLVFDFPIYSNVLDILNKLDLVVMKFKGKVYMTKDSRILKENFIKINNEFNDINFKKLRKKSLFNFSSINLKG